MPEAESDAVARLRELVDASGLTRTEVAARAGLSPGDLTRLLSGRVGNPKVDTVRRVLAAVDARWSDLDPPG